MSITHQEVRRLHRRRRRHLHRAPRPGHRLPRAQRRRQVHHHADHGRPHPAHLRAPPRSPAGGSPTCPTPGLEVGVLLDASAQHAGRTGREILTIAQRTMGLPDAAGRRDARPGQPDRRARPSRRVRNYSLGMRQRLGIATALIGDPEVLILDEPANGLDPAGIRWMRDLLRGYADRGGTVLLSSHLLHEIEVIADDLVVIGNGRIVAQGTKAELLAAAGTARPHAATSPALAPPCSAPASRSPTPTTAPAHRRRPRAGRPGRARRRRRPDRAPRRRRRRARGDVPRAHRRHPARRSSSMTATTVDPTAEPTPRTAPPGIRPHPADPAGRRRAAQDVRHPLGLLADGEHRHHRACSPPAPSSSSRPTTS